MSDREPHVILGEWLLNMGYPKDKFPPEDQLKKVCRGSIFRCFWKDVVKNVKPKKEVAFIKENIFVNSIRRYESIENTSKAKLGQVLPPEPLLLWKKQHENDLVLTKLRKDCVLSESTLTEKLLKIKMKCSNVERIKTSIENVQREIHLVKETIRQIKEDINQSKTLSHIATNIPCLKKAVKSKIKQNVEIDMLEDFFQFGNIKNKEESYLVSDNNSKVEDMKTIDDYETLFSTKFDEVDNIDVENLVENIDIPDLYKKLFDKRANMINKVIEDKKIEEELAEVEQDARSTFILPWRESLAQLNLTHCNIMLEGFQNKKDTKQASIVFQDLLKLKFLSAHVPQQTMEAIQIKCKYIELCAHIDSFKEFIQCLLNASGIFAGNIREKAATTQNYVNLTDDILALQMSHKSKQIVVHKNINKLSDCIHILKDIRKSVFDCLGHSDFGFSERNDSLNLSVFHPNSTMKSITVNKKNKNLIDAKQIYCESNANRQMKQHIHDACSILLDEIKRLKGFRLEANRKIVLDNGEKLWIDETIHHASNNNDLEVQQILFNVLNPSRTIPGIIQSYEAKCLWMKSLNCISLSIDKNAIRDLPSSKDLFIEYNEKNDSRIDNVMKNVQKSMKPLQIIDAVAARICKNIEFFKTFDAKQFISEDRLVNGRTYVETEYEIKNILLEESYWN